MNFNIKKMEAELTCPVCLELYTEPLMLPCSHSICRKCLLDIVETNSKLNTKLSVVECPSCRHAVPLRGGSIDSLPRNLVVENVVIRFTEDCGQSSQRQLSNGTSTVHAHDDVGLAFVSDLTSTPTDGCRPCELCDRPPAGSPCGVTSAIWYCHRCRLSYCRPCLRLFHPKRGSLASHRLLPASQAPVAATTATCCRIHPLEVATVYCEACCVRACHVCVCDGGAHAGHMVITWNAACERIKKAADDVKQEGTSLLDSIEQRRQSISQHVLNVDTLHSELSGRLDEQYDRLLADLTNDLQRNRDLVKSNMAAIVQSLSQHAASCSDALTRCGSVARQVVAAGTRLAGGGSGDAGAAVEIGTAAENADAADVEVMDTLAGSTELERLKSRLKDCITQVKTLVGNCADLTDDKTTQESLRASVSSFNATALESLRLLLDASSEQEPETTLHMRSALLLGGTSSHFARTLTTWGFTHTSFTALPYKASARWRVTLHPNSVHPLNTTTDYLFGIGVSSEILDVKGRVGDGETGGVGVVCVGGELIFSYAGQRSHIADFDGLPVNVSLAVTPSDGRVLVAFTVIHDDKDKDVIVCRRVIRDEVLACSFHPVFTISKHVKLQLVQPPAKCIT